MDSGASVAGATSPDIEGEGDRVTFDLVPLNRDSTA